MTQNRIPFPIPVEDRKALVQLGEKLVRIRRKSTSADLGEEYRRVHGELETLTTRLRFKYAS